ncbi:hypothetical protein T492DRAFT_1061334 [Pavlovales sp. CCMP2436]|nr:hypothetical protein T492DRAFT_1061334 [Pavlovales sp. CCMP2436]
MPTLWRAPTREHGSLPGSADFETLRLRAPRVAAVAESLIDLPGSVRKGVQGMRRLFVGDGQPADDFVPTPEEEVGKESESRAAFVARWRVLYSVLAAKAGGIRLADYRELLRLANEGREPTDLELEARFRDADHDGYGVIDFKRFMFGRGNEDTIAIVALTPEAVEQLRAASAAGEQDLRLAEQARQLLAVHDELNASLLPELLRGLISTRIALEPQTTGMLLSSYAAVGSIGESIARVRNARDRLDQLPERVRGGQSVRDSMPTLAAPRSQRHKGRWARLAPYMPPVAEVELAVLFLQFCGLTYSLQITFLKSSTDGAENTLLAASGKVLGWTSIFTLDLESLRSWAESVGANSIAAAASAPSYTTMYVSTCAAIPIVVAFAMLVNFMPLYQVTHT